MLNGIQFPACATMTEKEDWPKALFLSGTMPSPLAALLVARYSDVLMLTNSLSGGEENPWIILNSKPTFAYWIILFQLKRTSTVLL